ncbi:aromatic compound dioxygenase [Mycena olivaceomarginata]|nr:aromatic compound dioxygenase [Mycena olivaceomarginata]
MRFTSFVSLAVLCGIAADCSAEVARYNMERREARGLAKRTFYTNMLNLTCVLAPETIREDYIANAPIRTDVTESQPGVALTLDIGVLDTTTCKPLSNAMVELWGPNAVGEYGSTFLRGATETASNGIAEFQTISRIHDRLCEPPQHSVSHIGQLFFTDPWTDIIEHEHRMKNAADPSFVAANKNGFSSIVDIESIHDDWPEGIIGYITVGVNPTKLVA